MTYRIFIFLAIIGFSTSCHQDNNMELKRADSFLNSEVDSTLSILQSLEHTYEEMPDNQKANYGFLYYRALDKKRSITMDKADYLDFSIHYYKENDVRKYAYCLIYKAGMFKNLRIYPEATECFWESLNAAKTLKDDLLIARSYYHLAHIAFLLNENKKALYYTNLSIDHYIKIGDINAIAGVYSLECWIYDQLQETDKVIELSKSILQIATDSFNLSDALLDLGYSYSKKNQNDSALYYIKQSLTYPFVEYGLSTRYIYLADVYYDMNEIDSAAYYFDTALQLPIDIYFQKTAYLQLRKIHMELNDTEKVKYYSDLYQATIDSITIIEKQINFAAAEEIFTLNNNYDRIKKQRRIQNISLLVLLLFSAYMIWFFSELHKKKKIEANKYKAEVDEKENMLDKKHESLISDLREELERIKDKYTIEGEKIDFQEKQKIYIQAYVEALCMDNEHSFLIKMNNVLNGIPDKLKKEYPTINTKEITWCCLFLLNIPNTDISLLMHYTQSSLYKLKQRIAKKLGFPGTRDLENMLFEKLHS